MGVWVCGGSGTVKVMRSVTSHSENLRGEVILELRAPLV